MLTPKNVSLYASAAFGKDDYIESEFGLRDNEHQIYTVDMDVMPTATFTFGASYSYEYYNALLRSRQAAPPSAQSPALPEITYQQYLALAQTSNSPYQVADARRNWSNDGTDRAHSFLLAAALTNLANKWDLHFSYDLNRADAAYNFAPGPVADRTLPDEVVVGTTLINCDVPENCILPLVQSDLDRLTMDLTYWVSQKIGFGGSSWYEQYRVDDWALDAEATARERRTSG